MEQKSNDKKTRLLILLLLLITLIAIVVTIWALFFRDNDLPVDYLPKETESNAVTIPGDSGDKLEKPDGGGSVSLSYSKEVKIDLSDGVAQFYFGNPGRSNQNMVLQIVIQGEVVVQTDLIMPGYQIRTMELVKGMAQRLNEGGYEGKFIISYYDAETNEKAIVNTEIPVTITVVQ